MINRRVREYGSKLTDFVAEHRNGTEAETGVPDNRKCCSQDNDRSFHEVQVTLGEVPEKNLHSLLNVLITPTETEARQNSMTQIRSLTTWK